MQSLPNSQFKSYYIERVVFGDGSAGSTKKVDIPTCG